MEGEGKAGTTGGGETGKGARDLGSGGASRACLSASGRGPHLVVSGGGVVPVDEGGWRLLCETVAVRPPVV
eukprot:954418-Pyramimonas_sp.AAC.1